MSRKENREGSARQLSDGSWECITQSKYLNPKTGSPKRFKRKGKTVILEKLDLQAHPIKKENRE